MDKISAIEKLPSPSSGVEHTEHIALDVEPYGPPGFRGIAASRYVAICASFSAIGGLLFGYE